VRPGVSKASYWEILAAAYAEVGEFTEAVKWQRKALDDKKHAQTYGEGARARLKLYEENKPYRQGRRTT
jgi:hypothetical protein